MYIPSFNSFNDRVEVVAFMQRYSFATIISVRDGLPVGTHLPFIVAERGDKIILSSHFAKANSQWADIINSTALAIFTEPHAYISPKNYEKKQNVPTWNYLAVHAYGKCTLLDDEKDKAALLERTIQTFETAYLKQWEKLPDDYKRNMMKGIVAFEMVVDDLQAKAKLSQNRSEKEQQNVINDLSNSTDSSEKAIADYMRTLNPK
jgi:transcriptional regulator